MVYRGGPVIDIKALQARAARLLAAELDPEVVAGMIGVPELRVLNWMEQRKFQRLMYLALLAHHSQLEAAKITGRRARGLLPPPLALEWLATDEGEEDADTDTA
ncbi:MAG TPA: hypothetical protein VGD46_17025 [Rhizobacter sp.]